MYAEFQDPFSPVSCKACRLGEGLDFSISMAFQPIWDSFSKKVFSQEALVRGSNGQGANWVFERVNSNNVYKFDQICRVPAIQKASELGLNTYLNINFLPNAVYKPETCIQSTLEASEEFGFPVDKIIFEVSETEKVKDEAHLLSIFSYYRKQGFFTAIDDFGAGYSGLKLLTRFVPDFIKIDMALIRDIHKEDAKFFVVEGIHSISNKLGCKMIAEGVESKEEYHKLVEIGIQYYQGYYFAMPGFESLPQVSLV